ncbi:MAG: hypothetical protein HYW93_07970 [Thaumarchaeota archaeon]|nr:hypothetical protein [Nitrososphaerota archaeon]
MTNVLGQGGMQAALYHLKLDQHGKNPKEFHENLHTIFKDGATILEKVIIKELYLRLGMPYREREPFDFEEHVNLAMQVASSRLRRRESL